MRTTAEVLTGQALEDLLAVLTGLGLRAGPGDGSAVVLEAPGGRITLEVTATAAKDAARIAQHLRDRVDQPGDDQAVVPFLVADQIPDGARRELRDAGWGYLDRRGRLWLRAAGVHVNDTELAPLPRRAGTAPTSTAPIAGRVGLGVALELLVHPTGGHSARSLAAAVGSSPSSANDAFRRLQDHALVDGAGLPLLPELFWAAADAWRPERHHVARVPAAPDVPASTMERWTLTGDGAAQALGAPVVSAGSPRPHLYLPDPAELRRIIRRLGPADPADAAAVLLLAPVPAAVQEVAGEETRGSLPWRIAHPVIVALDLAQDRARGREILEDWTPAGGSRVW